MEATDASRLVCVVVVSYQERILTHTNPLEATTGEAIVRPDGGLRGGPSTVYR